MQNYKNLHVWRRAHNLVLELYKITNKFPLHEMYGITSQIRRAGISIPNNIVEGLARRTKKDKSYFLGVSVASASEVEYLLILCSDLDYVDNTRSENLIKEVSEIRMMLVGLIKKVAGD